MLPPSKTAKPRATACLMAARSGPTLVCRAMSGAMPLRATTCASHPQLGCRRTPARLKAPRAENRHSAPMTDGQRELVHPVLAAAATTDELATSGSNHIHLKSSVKPQSGVATIHSPERHLLLSPCESLLPDRASPGRACL